MNNEPLMMLSYALATENDAITMYRFMIKNLPESYTKDLMHILREEKEHSEILNRLIKRASDED